MSLHVCIAYFPSSKNIQGLGDIAFGLPSSRAMAQANIERSVSFVKMCPGASLGTLKYFLLRAMGLLTRPEKSLTLPSNQE